MFNDDLQFLVNETLSHVVEKRDFYFTPDLELPSDVNIQVKELESEIPVCSGLIYNLQKNANTFLIRSIEAKNLADMYQMIQKTPEDFPKLRLIEDGQANLSNLKFIECDSVEEAKALTRELSNKRFPFSEENICNISDPGFTWWMSHDDTSMEVFFSLSHTHDMSQMVKIGPLGDTNIATKNFKQFYLFFSSIFPIEEFSVGRSHFKISALPQNKGMFNDLVNVFKTGDVSLELLLRLEEVERLLMNNQINSFTFAKNYLLELAAVRRFWDKIQDELVHIS